MNKMKIPRDVTLEKGWVARVDTSRQTVDFLGKRLNQFDGKFHTLEEFTLEGNDSIRRELGGRQAAEYELRETITSLECRLMEALSKMGTMSATMKSMSATMESMSAKMRALEKSVADGRCVGITGEREDKIEAPKPLIFKGDRDA